MLPSYDSIQKTARDLGRPIAALLVLVWFLGPGAEFGWSCPTCKDSLAAGGQGLQMGYALSIGLMMGTPMMILAGWIAALCFLCRKRSPKDQHPVKDGGHPGSVQDSFPHSCSI